jgi:hypothetical protein
MSANSKILKRLLVLMALVLCLGWFSLGDNVRQVYAYPCCEECPGFNGNGSEYQYCSDQCGGNTSGTCMTQCRNQVRDCYRNCSECGGGGVIAACYDGNDCPYIEGYGFGSCVNGNCVW